MEKAEGKQPQAVRGSSVAEKGLPVTAYSAYPPPGLSSHSRGPHLPRPSHPFPPPGHAAPSSHYAPPHRFPPPRHPPQPGFGSSCNTPHRNLGIGLSSSLSYATHHAGFGADAYGGYGDYTQPSSFSYRPETQQYPPQPYPPPATYPPPYSEGYHTTQSYPNGVPAELSNSTSYEGYHPYQSYRNDVPAAGLSNSTSYEGHDPYPSYPNDVSAGLSDYQSYPVDGLAGLSNSTVYEGDHPYQSYTHDSSYDAGFYDGDYDDY